MGRRGRGRSVFGLVASAALGLAVLLGLYLFVVNLPHTVPSSSKVPTVAGPAGALVTTAQASDITKAFWSNEERLMESPGSGSAAEIYSDSALPVAKEMYREMAAAGQHQLGPRLIRDVVVWVPVQKKYPLQFAAHLRVSGVNGNGAATAADYWYTIVFARNAASASWKAVWFVKSSSPGPPLNGGYIATPLATAVVISPSQLPQAYADFLNAWLVQGKTPIDSDLFAEAGYQSSLIVYHLKPPSIYVSTSKMSAYSYAPTGAGLFVLPNADGSQTVFFSMLRSATFTAYGAGCIGANSINYAAVPTGKFRSFTIEDYLMGSAAIPPGKAPTSTGIPRIHVDGDIDSGVAQLQPC